jgi:hypothetical protein
MRTLLVAGSMFLAGCASTPAPPSLTFGAGNQLAVREVPAQGTQHRYTIAVADRLLEVELMHELANVAYTDQGQYRSAAAAAAFFRSAGFAVEPNQIAVVANRLGTAFVFVGHRPDGRYCAVLVETPAPNEVITGGGCAEDPSTPAELGAIYSEFVAMAAGIQRRT